MEKNFIDYLLKDANEALNAAKHKLKQINSNRSIDTYEKICKEIFICEPQMSVPPNLFENIINPEKFSSVLNAAIDLGKMYKKGETAMKNKLRKIKMARNPFLPRSVTISKLDVNKNEDQLDTTPLSGDDCLELDDVTLEHEISENYLQILNNSSGHKLHVPAEEAQFEGHGVHEENIQV